MMNEDTKDDGWSRHRKRKCGDCGKPLGSTLGYCYECGGENRRAEREERLADAYTWKILLGVKPKLIEEAHEDNTVEG